MNGELQGLIARYNILYNRNIQYRMTERERQKLRIEQWRLRLIFIDAYKRYQQQRNK